MQTREHPVDVEVVNLTAAPILERAEKAPDPLTCKFVIIGHSSKLHLVFGPVSVFPYHANLVGQFCQDKVLGYTWVKQPDVIKILDSTYRVLGGGYLELDFSRNRAKFSGSSKAYGYYSLDDVRAITSIAQFFSRFAVQIES